MRGPWWAPLLVTLLLVACEASETTSSETGDTTVDVSSASDSTTDGTGTTPDDVPSGPVDDAGEAPVSDVGDDPGDTEVGDDASVPYEAGWQEEPLGDLGNLNSLFAINSGEAYAVGGSQVVRYNGQAWASFGSLEGAALHGVWSGDGVVVVVGEAGFVARRHVTDLSWQIEESGTFQHLRAVHGRSADDIWAMSAASCCGSALPI